ncbi:MAG: hypothetical protein HY520_00405 [Candidatus Aenigmarchaeota archaeon]|nr:hypothetical protein [Candidatus Aenigmarchaeota archaeon]
MDEQGEGAGKKMIAELISHLSQLEQKMTGLEETIADASDLQLVNKLDIINLKNELEKLRLSVPTLEEDQVEALRQFSALAEKGAVKHVLDTRKVIEEITKRLDAAEKQLGGIQFPPVEEFQMQLSELRSRMESTRLPGSLRQREQQPRLKEIEKAVEGLQKGEPRLRSLEKAVEKLAAAGGLAPLEEQLAPLEKQLAPLEQRVAALERAPRSREPGRDRRLLEQRLAALEGTRKEPGSGLAQLEKRLAAAHSSADRRIAQLEQRLAAFAHAPPPREAAGSAGKLAQLEREVRAARAQLAALQPSQLEARLVRRERASTAGLRKSLEREWAEALAALKLAMDKERRGELARERKEIVALMLKELGRMMQA